MPSKKALQTLTYDETIPLKFKVIDQDHPEIFWLVETLPASPERIYLEYNFADVIKGWFSIVPKYIFKSHKIHYGSLYYTLEEAQERKLDGNFAVVELIWEQL
jgi:hypothetical protein